MPLISPGGRTSDPGFTATILAIEAMVAGMSPKKRRRMLWRVESAGDRMVVDAIGRSNVYAIGDAQRGGSRDEMDVARTERRDAGEYLRQAVWFIRDHRFNPRVG